MSSKHLIDPELVAGLELFPPFDLSADILPAMRAQMDGMTAAMPVPEGLEVDVAERTVPSATGPDVPVLVYTPRGRAMPRPGILHIHGGGYVVGSARMNDVGNRMLSHELGVVIVSVDYRLAPETPHPGPVEDCYSALKWMFGNADALGVDRKRIAVAGESAGGGLAAALALLARDRAEVQIAFQHLIYPMIDDRTCIEAVPHAYAGEFVWTPPANRFGWTALLGHEPGRGDVSPYAAAARAEKLEGLPPAFISVGALDLFLEENLEYARRLTRAGVPTELHVYPGAYHGFNAIAGAQAATAAQRDSVNALRRALYPNGEG